MYIYICIYTHIYTRIYDSCKFFFSRINSVTPLLCKCETSEENRFYVLPVYIKCACVSVCVCVCSAPRAKNMGSTCDMCVF